MDRVAAGGGVAEAWHAEDLGSEEVLNFVLCCTLPRSVSPWMAAAVYGKTNRLTELLGYRATIPELLDVPKSCA